MCVCVCVYAGQVSRGEFDEDAVEGVVIKGNQMDWCVARQPQGEKRVPDDDDDNDNNDNNNDDDDDNNDDNNERDEGW
jgi:hypothetical protein